MSGGTGPGTAPPGEELFVYYRVAPVHAEALNAAVQALQSRLRAEQPGLNARLLHRPDLRDGLQTWMEVYALPPGADTEAVALRIERTAREALAPWLASPRHVERFVACA